MAFLLPQTSASRWPGSCVVSLTRYGDISYSWFSSTLMATILNRRFLLLLGVLSLGYLSALKVQAATACSSTYSATPNDDVIVNSGATCNGIDVSVGNYLNSLTVNQGGTVTARLINGQNTAVYVDFNGSGIGTFTNSGSITGGTVASIEANRYIASFNNTATGVVSGGAVGIYTWSQGQQAPNQFYAFGSLSNAGSISGSNYGIQMILASRIETLTNRGTIDGGIRDIHLSNSTIDTLNNLQGAGNASGGLTYEGKLPTNYNIILGSNATTYGQLIATSITGQLIFGIHSGTVRSTRYTGVLQGISAADIASGLTGTYSGYAYELALQTGQTDIWDLLFPSYVAPTAPLVSAANTLLAVKQNASALASAYAMQAGALQASLGYDCSTFDDRGVCASVGSRTTYTDAGGNQAAGLVIVSFAPSPRFRLGGFIDQSATTRLNRITQRSNNPMYGFFAYWRNNENGLGLGASIASAFTRNSLGIARDDALADTEAGSGNTRMSGQSAQALLTYSLQAGEHLRVSPYVGLRYYRLATGAYTEETSADVTRPLSYEELTQKQIAAVYGIELSTALSAKLSGSASVGMQENLNYRMSNYTGTSTIADLASFSVQMPSNIHSMASASASMNYAVSRNKRLGIKVLWQQQAFSATHTVTALANYSFSF